MSRRIVETLLPLRAAGGTISIVESVTEGDKLVAYEAHVRKAGKHSEVRVAPDGNSAPAE